MGLEQRFSSLVTRRAFIRAGLYGAGVVSVGVGSWGCKDTPIPPVALKEGGADIFGALQAPDANGLKLPPGFTSRIVAVSSQPVGKSGFVWPIYPDGAAVFPTSDGGWIYAANSEVSSGKGGVGALRFAADGTLVDAYSILTGTSRNCAGGPTPNGKWLSCEEHDAGQVWECDPFAPGSQGIARPAMGIFEHEAVAVDPSNRQLYLTEDKRDGLLYRFTPTQYPDLQKGQLEAAEILGDGAIQPGEVRTLAWHAVEDPAPVQGGVDSATYKVVAQRATRYQVTGATPFAGGEGCWFESGIVYFTTKKDNRVWAVDSDAGTIKIIYDLETSEKPMLSGVDNVMASSLGDVYVAEDGGDMQLIALTASGDIKPVVEVANQSFSEVAGPVLSPDGTRLYFSSQRGPTPSGNLGITYEVTGPFAPL
jgi:secreted PhoX family phosphatase